MKKLIALLFTIVCIFALAGCSNDDVFTEKTYSADKTDVESITVDVEDRELEIYASYDGKINIDYFNGEKEYLDISVSESKELTVKLIYNKNWTDYVGFKPSADYRKIKIGIPDNAIASFSATTTNENISIGALSLKENLSLKCEGGDVICERVNAGKSVSLKAKNGDITGSIIGGWDDFSISCKIKNGECNLPLNKENGEKKLIADCNNGDIKIEFLKTI